MYQDHATTPRHSPLKTRYNVDAVKAALSGEKILARFSIEGRGSREIRIDCPCGAGPRNACRVHAETGDYLHHGGPGNAGPCRGDALDLVALCMGRDIRKHFPEILEEGAKIGGVSPDIDPAEIDRIIAESKARQAAREARYAEQRARGEALVPGIWNALRLRHPQGERYLTGRRLDPETLRDRNVVRFDKFGNPCVALRSFDTGAVINIVRRRLDWAPGCGFPKCLVLKLSTVLQLDDDDDAGSLSTRGSLVGHVAHAAWNGCGITVLVEGLADSLAATLAYTGCTIVGANGCDNMEHVAAAVAPHVVKARGVLLIGVHHDEQKQGVLHSAAAARAAMRAGLVLHEGVRGIDIGGHKDFCDAWAAGWRSHWIGVAA